ncbi:hypothetical protein B0H14DRAFT_2583041 [Mycena olivaceomarginata]|nr:hypothetical protein B0H14DRAFT_2583041 [Mycena olivaceomarginata]
MGLPQASFVVLFSTCSLFLVLAVYSWPICFCICITVSNSMPEHDTPGTSHLFIEGTDRTTTAFGPNQGSPLDLKATTLHAPLSSGQKSDMLRDVQLIILIGKAVNFAGRGDGDIPTRVELGVVEENTWCFVRRRAGNFDQSHRSRVLVVKYCTQKRPVAQADIFRATHRDGMRLACDAPDVKYRKRREKRLDEGSPGVKCWVSGCNISRGMKTAHLPTFEKRHLAIHEE